MSQNVRHIFKVMETTKEVEGYCDEGEVTGILPDRRGCLGFASYVTRSDWKYAHETAELPAYRQLHGSGLCRVECYECHVGRQQ